MNRRTVLSAAVVALAATGPAAAVEYALPDDGYYTLETVWTAAEGSRIVCRSEESTCDVRPGEYVAVNHSLPRGDPAHRQRVTLEADEPDAPPEPIASMPLVRVSETCGFFEEEITPNGPELVSCTATCDGELVGLLGCSASLERLSVSAPSRGPSTQPDGQFNRSTEPYSIASFSASGNALSCSVIAPLDAVPHGRIARLDIIVTVACR